MKCDIIQNKPPSRDYFMKEEINHEVIFLEIIIPQAMKFDSMTG